MSASRPRGRLGWLWGALGLGLALALVASLLLGYRSLSPAALLGWSQDLTLRHLILEYRLPRMLIAPVCGAALAVSGCLLQSLTRNPLAAPDVLGVNAAASFCVVLALFIQPDLGLGWLNGLAFVAALAMTRVLLWLLGREGARHSLLRLPLLGSVLAMLFAALTQTLITLDPSTQDQALSWLTGNIAGRSLRQFWAALPWLLLAVVGLWRLWGRLDLFYLGDAQIRSLGQEPDTLRRQAVLISSLLVAAVVGVIGPIGFIGLLVPRMALRLSTNGNSASGHSASGHRHWLPRAALLGALLLTLADLLARFIYYPEDIPAGVVTALLGGPAFLFLLYRQRGRSDGAG